MNFREIDLHDIKTVLRMYIVYVLLSMSNFARVEGFLFHDDILSF